jgi:hypothetical protein
MLCVWRGSCGGEERIEERYKRNGRRGVVEVVIVVAIVYTRGSSVDEAAAWRLLNPHYNAVRGNNEW